MSHCPPSVRARESSRSWPPSLPPCSPDYGPYAYAAADQTLWLCCPAPVGAVTAAAVRVRRLVPLARWFRHRRLTPAAVFEGDGDSPNVVPSGCEPWCQPRRLTRPGRRPTEFAFTQRIRLQKDRVGAPPITCTVYHDYDRAIDSETIP